MSDAKALRELAERASQISVKLPGDLGLASIRMPTPYERGLAYAAAAKATDGDSLGASLHAARHLLALCLKSWSVTPRMLVGDLAKGDGADDVMPVSQEAVFLLFDQHPGAYRAMEDAFYAELARRSKELAEAEKN